MAKITRLGGASVYEEPADDAQPGEVVEPSPPAEPCDYVGKDSAKCVLDAGHGLPHKVKKVKG